MKTSQTLAALSFALGTAFAGSAFADGATYDYAQPIVSHKTRAEVQAELFQARANGDIAVGEAGLPRVTFVAQKSRSDVQAETLAAVSSGELRRLNLEYSTSSRMAPERLQPAAVVTARSR